MSTSHPLSSHLAHRSVEVKDLFGGGDSIICSGVCGVPFLPQELSTNEVAVGSSMIKG